MVQVCQINGYHSFSTSGGIQLCDTLIAMSPNQVVSDIPCNLISKGVFDTLFPEDLIAFDEKTGSFRMKK